jgi:hypothetical protein
VGLESSQCIKYHSIGCRDTCTVWRDKYTGRKTYRKESSILKKNHIATILQIVGCVTLAGAIATFSIIGAVLFTGSVLLLFGLAVERSE